MSENFKMSLERITRDLKAARTTRHRKVEDLSEEELLHVRDLLSKKYSKKAIGLIFSLSYGELKRIKINGDIDSPELRNPPRRG